SLGAAFRRLASRQAALASALSAARATLSSLASTRAARSVYISSLAAERNLTQRQISTVVAQANAAQARSQQLARVSITEPVSPVAGTIMPGAATFSSGAPVVAGARTITVSATGYALAGR